MMKVIVKGKEGLEKIIDFFGIDINNEEKERILREIKNNGKIKLYFGWNGIVQVRDKKNQIIGNYPYSKNKKDILGLHELTSLEILELSSRIDVLVDIYREHSINKESLMRVVKKYTDKIKEVVGKVMKENKGLFNLLFNEKEIKTEWEYLRTRRPKRFRLSMLGEVVDMDGNVVVKDVSELLNDALMVY